MYPFDPVVGRYVVTARTETRRARSFRPLPGNGYMYLNLNPFPNRPSYLKTSRRSSNLPPPSIRRSRRCPRRRRSNPLSIRGSRRGRTSSNPESISRRRTGVSLSLSRQTSPRHRELHGHGWERDGSECCHIGPWSVGLLPMRVKCLLLRLQSLVTWCPRRSVPELWNHFQKPGGKMCCGKTCCLSLLSPSYDLIFHGLIRDRTHLCKKRGP